MDAVHMGAVYLRVADLKKQVAFYEQVIGLREIRTEGDTVYLGTHEEQPLLALMERPHYKAAPRSTGLYHLALRVPTRLDLAQMLEHFARSRTPLQGMSDHIVSEAIYLPDAEGNGIEIYRDRPVEDWYVDGEFQLATLALDVNNLFAELQHATTERDGLPMGTVMGHVHLHVADIAQTEAFYTGILNMDVMTSISSATFLSYNGYHHHLGANIWAGRTPPPDTALGLDHFVMAYTDAADLENVVQHLHDKGVPMTPTDAGYLLRDPSQNQMRLTVA